MKIFIISIILICNSISAYATVIDQMLMEAIRDGNQSKIITAIESGAHINSDGNKLNPALPPLVYAIILNNPETVSTLLNQGADPNLIQGNHCPLLYAVNADTRILKLMLESKADPNIQTPQGETILQRAAICKPETYLELIKNGHYKGTPPYCSESVKLLIKSGAEINAIGNHEDTPLMNAIRFNAVEVARQLLESGANPEAQTPEGGTALILALNQYALEKYDLRNGHALVFGSWLPMIELLLKNNANPNAKNKGTYDDYQEGRQVPYSSGYTPLTLSARHGWLPVVKLLLKHGADSSLPRQDGNTALDIAEKNGHKKVAALIRNYNK